MNERLFGPPEREAVNFCGMITAAPEMFRLFDLLKRVARSEASVLIRGETGVGKELVAQAIHQLSRRSAASFAAINCAMLSSELLASELFGHVRGAFTGAVRDHKGLFQVAHRGTVFLDEIAELPLDIQARLLRVLQERKITPVGSTSPIDVDIRLLSATHQSLREEVQAGRFRTDLMYRIRVVPVYVPPLIEREGDVELLVWHFIRAFQEREDRTITAISALARDALLQWPWPGNVRELRNAIEYAFAVGEGDVLVWDDLPPDLRGVAPPERHSRPDPDEADERTRFLSLLAKHQGRREAVAAELGISRTTLWRKLKGLGL